MRERPIIFSGPMVCAIEDGRKTQTRRVVKFRPGFEPGGPFCRLGVLDTNGSINSRVDHLGRCVYHTGWAWQTEHGWCNCRPATYAPPTMPGDLIYVRETWAIERTNLENFGGIYPGDWRACWVDQKLQWGVDTIYKASQPDDTMQKRAHSFKDGSIPKWRSARFMPKVAARIWLKVTDVRVERLQDIDVPGDIIAEGVEVPDVDYSVNERPDVLDFERYNYALEQWSGLWNSINKKRGFGWDANPWVWVVAFERHDLGEH